MADTMQERMEAQLHLCASADCGGPLHAGEFAEYRDPDGTVAVLHVACGDHLDGWERVDPDIHSGAMP